MPTIFTEDGFRFCFCSNEHDPIHVHVKYGGSEAIFEVGNDVVLKETKGMSIKDLTKAQRLTKKTSNSSGKNGMCVSRDNGVIEVTARHKTVTIRMPGGLKISFPTARNPRLANGTDAQLNHVEVSPFGVHWPDLDEDLSFAGLSKGDYGQHVKFLGIKD